MITETSYQVGNSTNYVQISCHGAVLHVRSAILHKDIPSEQYLAEWVAEVRTRFRDFNIGYRASVSRHPQAKRYFIVSVGANRKKGNEL